MRQGPPRIPRQWRQNTSNNMRGSSPLGLKKIKKWGWLIFAILVASPFILSLIFIIKDVFFVKAL